MSEAKNANIVIEIYHILHSVQSSGQSSIDDVISYYKLRQAKFSYNSQSNNFNISNSDQRKLIVKILRPFSNYHSYKYIEWRIYSNVLSR